MTHEHILESILVILFGLYIILSCKQISSRQINFEKADNFTKKFSGDISKVKKKIISVWPAVIMVWKIVIGLGFILIGILALSGILKWR